MVCSPNKTVRPIPKGIHVPCQGLINQRHKKSTWEQEGCLECLQGCRGSYIRVQSQSRRHPRDSGNPFRMGLQFPSFCANLLPSPCRAATRASKTCMAICGGGFGRRSCYGKSTGRTGYIHEVPVQEAMIVGSNPTESGALHSAYALMGGVTIHSAGPVARGEGGRFFYTGVW